MPYPAVLPALAICAGVTAGVFLPFSIPGCCILLFVLWVAALLAFALRRDRAVMLLAVLGFAAAGGLLGALANLRARYPPLREHFNQALTSTTGREVFAVLEGHLRQDAVPGPSGVSLNVWVERIDVNGSWRETAGGVLATVRGVLGAERAGDWRAGRTVRFPATLRRPARYLDAGVRDSELALAWRGTTLVGSVTSAALVDVVSPGGRLAEGAATARRAARRAIEAGVGRWSTRSSAVVAAILIGERAGLDDEMERRLQEAGTYHVIAISGGNIAIFTGLILGLLRLCPVTPRWAHLLAILLLSAYAYFVGGGSSVNRATLMAVAYLAAQVIDHRTAPINAIGAAGAAILCATPLAIVDPAFALTFGATLGILVGAGSSVARAGGRWWIRAPLLLLAASVCAEAALLPVSAFVFSRVTFAGLALNFAAIPLMAVVQVAGLATIGLSICSSGAAMACGYVAHLAVRGLVDSARLVDIAPWLNRRVPAPGFAIMAAYYIGIAMWVFATRRSRAGTMTHTRWIVVRRIAGAATVVAGLWILNSPVAWPKRSSAPRLRVTFLDVGQGDSLVVQFPNDRTLLVDAGGVPGGSFDIGGRVVAPALWALGLRRLDYLAVTHGDPDHVGGARSVVRDFRPREVWEGVPVPRHEPVRLLRSDAEKTGAVWRTLQAGDRLSVGGAELRVWSPPLPDWERQRVRNDDSLVMEASFGSVSVWMTGDIGREVERELTPALVPSGVRILKVPHHGSGTSSSAEFLRALRPAIAVISAGRGNLFGHPVPSVLERYQDIGAAIFRTDQDGAVTVETDGRTIWVQTFTGRALMLGVIHPS